MSRAALARVVLGVEGRGVGSEVDLVDLQAPLRQGLVKLWEVGFDFGHGFDSFDRQGRHHSAVAAADVDVDAAQFFGVELNPSLFLIGSDRDLDLSNEVAPVHGRDRFAPVQRGSGVHKVEVEAAEVASLTYLEGRGAFNEVGAESSPAVLSEVSIPIRRGAAVSVEPRFARDGGAAAFSLVEDLSLEEERVIRFELGFSLFGALSGLARLGFGLRRECWISGVWLEVSGLSRDSGEGSRFTRREARSSGRLALVAAGRGKRAQGLAGLVKFGSRSRCRIQLRKASSLAFKILE